MTCRRALGRCRYTKGQHFGRHIDETVELGGGGVTGYTLLIYLSGGLAGGETMFYGEAWQRKEPG